jgi:small-conductance mechanosensitive channel
MTLLEIQLIETLAIILFYVLAFFVTKTVINNALKSTQLQRTRRKIIIKVVHLFTSIAVVIVLAGVWGLEQNEIAVFASTILTALGIAFFAQWSLLSNITSSIILFFNHPLKLGDRIKILDNDYPFEGEITDLTYFFVYVKTKDEEIVSIPNSILLQKSVSIIVNQDKE